MNVLSNFDDGDFEAGVSEHNIRLSKHQAAALPLKRTIDVSDGDLVLINTGRFHNVEPFDSAFRLSGQCWLSFQRDKALRMWV